MGIFSILILRFNLFSNSILFYLFNLIFVGRLFLLILFVLSIRRLIQTVLNFNFIKVLILILIILILKILILNFNLFNFSFSFNFVIILGFMWGFRGHGGVITSSNSCVHVFRL